MGEGDFTPAGGHRRRYDPYRAEAIKNGGKKAQQIAKTTGTHHQVIEIPQAEEELMKELEEMEASPDPSKGGEKN